MYKHESNFIYIHMYIYCTYIALIYTVHGSVYCSMYTYEQAHTVYTVLTV